MKEHINLLKEKGLPIPPPNPNPKIIIQNEEKGANIKAVYGTPFGVPVVSDV